MARRRRSGERHHPQRHVARARVLVAVRAGGVRVFFFNDTATTEIYTGWYTLPLHDALPISCPDRPTRCSSVAIERVEPIWQTRSTLDRDRKSTRLNSVTPSNLVCRLLPEKKKTTTAKNNCIRFKAKNTQKKNNYTN